MESHAEKSQRKSYYERMQSKGQVGGGASSGKGQDAGGAGGQNESKSKSDQKTSSRGDTTEEKAEDSAQRRGEAAEGDKQQQQDDARQSVAESSTLPLDELESEASQESAFDPETNTINWDCPCLGGMAHGPCGDEFKEAFSCFVFSEKEPKGIECVEKFKGMQDCFRKYPEHYKEELEDDEEYEKHDGETLERKGEEHFASHAGGDQEEDDGLKEWRSELAKEGTN
jgi:intermembrane space import and assembly protein 40